MYVKVIFINFFYIINITAWLLRDHPFDDWLAYLWLIEIRPTVTAKLVQKAVTQK